MRKRTRGIVVAAAMIAATASLPARSGPEVIGFLKDQIAVSACSGTLQSLADHGYNYCGQHWRLSKLPIRFVVNTSGMPAAIAADFVRAADLAALTWDLGSPINGTGPRPARCPAAKLICIASVTTSGGMSTSDGNNTITWANMPTTMAPGYAVIAPSSGARIEDVDIQLNGSLTWFWAGTDLVTGLSAGPIASFCPVCQPHYDIQSILTHEFGHALGLLHVNPGDPAVWPADLTDAPDYNLVMYPFYYANNATQRLLGWGDILGLNVVAKDSFLDP